MNLISVVRDFNMFDKCIRNNLNCSGMSFHIYDNRKENKPIPICYNNFLEQYDYSNDSWFVFCHEDFELQENISVFINGLDKKSLHGVVGGRRKGLCGFGMQVIYGNMMEKNRDGSGEAWFPGRFVSKPVVVEAFDCCCLMVHSSLVQLLRCFVDLILRCDIACRHFACGCQIASV